MNPSVDELRLSMKSKRNLSKPKLPLCEWQQGFLVELRLKTIV